MSRSRRQFLMQASAGLLGAAAVRAAAQTTEPPPGTPPAFGTGPQVGPEVSPTTFTEAEKLVQIELTESEREIAARAGAAIWPRLRTSYRAPQSIARTDSCTGTQWDPVLPGQKAGPERDRFVRSKADPGPLPSSDEDIAFSPVTKLSRWIETRKLTSERLTNIYLERLERFDPKLRCVITLLREPALAQAKQADAEIAAGKYRGPLHGIPWGAKDLLDTANIPTTYGAEPFRNRVPGGRRGRQAPECCRRGSGRQAQPGRAGIE